MDHSILPAVNAGLNAVAALLLVRGRLLIARRDVDGHRRTMLAAFAVSAVFLACYVAHKIARGGVNTPYNGEGAARIAYLAILFSHIPLAAAVPLFAIRLIVLGLRGDLARHRGLARFAWPVWLYVSVTGVVIYLLLYPFNPVPGQPTSLSWKAPIQTSRTALVSLDESSSEWFARRRSRRFALIKGAQSEASRHRR